MGRIKTRWYYTELCEHYLRMAVRYTTVSRGSSQYWYDITKGWIDKLSDEDKEFIRFVFSKQFCTTAEGLYCYQSKGDMFTKRLHLMELEKAFALEAGLIGEYNAGESLSE